jgi:hypothetical protein
MSRTAPIGNEWNPPAARFGPEVNPPVPPDPAMIEWWMRGTNFGDEGNEDFPWDTYVSGTLGNVFGFYGAQAIYIRKMSMNRVDPPANNEILDQEIATDEVAPTTIWTPFPGEFDTTEPTIEVYDAATGRWTVTLPDVTINGWSGGVLQVFTETPGLQLLLAFSPFDNDYVSAAWEYLWAT